MNAGEYTFTVDDIRAEEFHPKGITEPAEAFAFLDRLIPCRENAFLLNRHLSGFPY